MKDRLLSMTRHPISLLGAALTTASAVLIISLFALEVAGMEFGPYVGILAFLVLPGLFVVGLAMIPIGLWFARKREAAAIARGETNEAAFPVLDFNAPRTRRGFLLFLSATLFNVIILGAATYKGVEVSDSTAFCGKTCHKVMQPEYTAWQNGPHARVACVNCHIGPGAGWFVKSKMSGTWQVIAVTFNLYPRPIPSPVRNLRPARETCEQCHWPTKFVGDRLKVITHFAEDEKNTEKKTVLLVRVGGQPGAPGEGKSLGIHWHVDPKVQIRYHADENREKIDQVELTRGDGTKTVYSLGKDQSLPANTGAWRTMDCVDCHNRPSHTYRLPDVALDQAIETGAIDRSLPFVRREGLRLLKAGYTSHEDARAKIATGLAAFYAKERPDVASAKKAAIDAAARELAAIYGRNVFPQMHVDWGTYKNHIGHNTDAGSPGCFRCHDDDHKSTDGKTIGQDCGTCHNALAVDEENPAVLKQLNP